jgi:hypothetical protein
LPDLVKLPKICSASRFALKPSPCAYQSIKYNPWLIKVNQHAINGRHVLYGVSSAFPIILRIKLSASNHLSRELGGCSVC